MTGFQDVGTVVAGIERGPDLQLRVSRLELDGEAFVDIREFIPSTNTWGRGVMVPVELKKPLLAALKEV